MRFGFNQMTLGIASAALLSGTAFAVGPTVSAPPTLIITQRVNQASIDGGATAVFDSGTAVGATTAQGIYRFTEAIDLSNYITIPAPGDINTVKWDFAELNAPGGTPLSTGRTIEINDGSFTGAGFAGPFTYGNVTTSPFSTVPNSDPLTFNNFVRTGNQTAFEDTTTLRLYAASTADTNQSVVSAEFTVITENNSGLGDRTSAPSSIFTPVAQFETLGGWSKSFEFNFATNFVTTRAQLTATGAQIISRDGTSNGPGNLSNTTNWATTTPVQFAPAINTYNFITGPITTNPGVVNDTVLPRDAADGNTLNDNPYYVTPNSTDSILLRTFSSTAPTLGSTGTLLGAGQPSTNSLFTGWAPQFLGFISGREGQNEGQFVSVTAGEVLLARWYLTDAGSPTAAQATRQPQISLRMGNQEDLYGMGQALSIYIPNGRNTLYGTQEYRQYFYAHDTGRVYFQIETNTSTPLAGGTNDLQLTLNRIDVASFDRADLTGETVVFNQGAPTLTLGTGPLAVAAPAGSVPFDTANVWRNANNINGFGRVSYTPADNASLPATATQLQITVGAATSLANTDLTIYGGGWDTVGTLIAATATGDEIIPVDNNKIYFFDYWLSTPAPSAVLPEVRVGFTTSDRGRTGGFNLPTPTSANEGRQAFFAFFTDTAPTTRLDGTNGGTALALQTGAKRYTVVYEAQVDPAIGTGLDVRPAIETFGFPGFVGSKPWNSAGTINIDRVVVTSYDAPSDVSTAGK